MADLYEKLYEHRESLRDAENKHTPTAILSDAALKGLSRAKPMTREDMLKVSGIGKAFIEKYADGFLDIILSEAKPVKLTMMRKEVRDTLKNLQARLTNVNRRNRMLYLPKPTPGRAVDLFCADGKIVEALLAFSGVPITVCGAADPEFSQFTRLIRAADAAARETGGNTLYVGYPFVTGKCGAGQSFNVAAPLALFPVKLMSDGAKITLSTDDSRDVTYNKALILCHNKFNGKGGAQLPDCVVSDIPKREFIQKTLAFYAQNGINISAPKQAALEKYFSYTEKSFPDYEPNSYSVANCVMAGLFPMYSGEIQKDFDDLIESGVMPATLTALLEGADEVEDFYSESLELIDPIAVGSEGAINYISDLNVSQEMAIERIALDRELVMQGPPGTGKSQTITSMITDAVNKGKNVLVVSQKRAALSVIYSRLGRLSRYALFVDDPKDKPAFYGKLKNMFEAADAPAPFNSVAFERAVRSVDGDIAELDEIADKLSDDTYGAPMLQIYKENFNNPFEKLEREGSARGLDEINAFRDAVSDALLECGYEEIKAARDYLDDEKLLEVLRRYYELGENFEWLINMKKGLSDGNIGELLVELDKILDLYAYSRFKFKFKKALKAFVLANFESFDKPTYKKFVKDPVELYNGVKAYGEFYQNKITADSLDFCTRLYFGSLYNIHKTTETPLAALNGKLVGYCGYALIDIFERDNRETLSRVAGFSSIVSRICSAIDKKMTLTRDKTLNLLKTTFNTNIAESKRRGEILRAIDGKRRPEVARFAEKFEFELFRGVRIFLMTPEAVSDILPLKNNLFDLLVFDEASQIYVERGIPAIARCSRLVVCGDHKQLRPSSLGDGRVTVDEDEESDAVLEEESLLDIARFKFPEVMLSYHYRSRYEELIAFSNAAFYGGKLNISPDADPPDAPPIKVHKVNGMWDDRMNIAEAERTVELIAEILESGAELAPDARDTIGVITFNAKQRDCILDLIDKKCDIDARFKALYLEEYTRRKDGEDLGLFVKNIENVQGDERDRIIFSFAYAYNNKGVMSRNFGWLNRLGGENRLNVAISRAKKHIDIVTSIIPSDLKIDDTGSQGVILLRKYLDYAYCVSDGDRASAKQVLDSFGGIASEATGEADGLKLEVATALEKKGLAVERDVGMGNYKLDIAIKNKLGDYVLGIECDSEAIASTPSTRERDVMRGKFLSGRGWNIYRVWSSDWYNDKDRVVREIEKLVA